MSKEEAWAREYFKGRCPYTGKHCDNWECAECETEKQEREWIRQQEEEA